MLNSSQMILLDRLSWQIVSISDEKIQISLLILRWGALSTGFVKKIKILAQRQRLCYTSLDPLLAQERWNKVFEIATINCSEPSEFAPCTWDNLAWKLNRPKSLVLFQKFRAKRMSLQKFLNSKLSPNSKSGVCVRLGPRRERGKFWWKIPTIKMSPLS